MVTHEKWVMGEPIRIGYTRFQLAVHLLVIALSLAQYVHSLTPEPIWESLGTLPSLCLLFITLHHALLLVVYQWVPSLFEFFIIYGTPFAYGCVWIHTWFRGTALDPAIVGSDIDSPWSFPPSLSHSGGGTSMSLLASPPPPPASLLLPPLQASSSSPPPWSLPGCNWFAYDACWLTGRPLTFALWWIIWVLRRNAFGIVVFQRITSHGAPYKRWAYRLYCLVCPCLIILLWKWYPALLATWDIRGYYAREALPVLLARRIHLTRSDASCFYMGLVGVLAGVSHCLWYSFLSFSYDTVVWSAYLREGVAVWMSGPRAIASKLV
ncbi:hypothetical protein IWQ60_005026 [Tieghemiomyces parasiticus]|uniref:Uncharacterized protein n=1 Tax=Tieghemiomyces parasiticus TaxID=78921 RepID=A0A9W8A784_9FUNG|nr:hypothetical protein IWQ60_005026 [Tieghemiomyces parasiticus]